MSAGRIPTTANSPLTTKGDLFTYSTSPARLAVGSNGETIVADSSTSTGLRYQANFAAGKNKIINGDMNVWQRGTSLTGSSDYVYGADRFRSYAYASNSTTVSRQNFTAGNEITGYEPTYFMRINSTNTGVFLEQPIEDVRTLAGQTATLSFWAKAASAHTLTVQILQFFGSGGSATVTTNLTSQSITTSWARYTVTVSVPSISGKTIGTNNAVYVRLINTSTNNNFDIWGVQLEAGSIATPFQTATGTIQGELAACQRYYWRNPVGASAYFTVGVGMNYNTTNSYINVQNPVVMRVAPTSLDYSDLRTTTANGTLNATTLTLSYANAFSSAIIAGSSGMVAGNATVLMANGNTSAYIGLSAEL